MGRHLQDVLTTATVADEINGDDAAAAAAAEASDRACRRLLIGAAILASSTLLAVFTGEAVVTDGRLTATVSTVIRGSAFDVGPINIARLAHTDDDITLEFDLVANRIDLDAGAIDSLETELAPDEIAGGAFAEHVQPVLEANCVSCHTSGGPGWSTLALDTVADAAAIADDIALVTGAGYMPPWLPSEPPWLPQPRRTRCSAPIST